MILYELKDRLGTRHVAQQTLQSDPEPGRLDSCPVLPGCVLLAVGLAEHFESFDKTDTWVACFGKRGDVPQSSLIRAQAAALEIAERALCDRAEQLLSGLEDSFHRLGPPLDLELEEVVKVLCRLIFPI